MRRWRPYLQRYLAVRLVGLVQLVGLVGLALWLGLALNKYRCDRPDNDDDKRPIGKITGTLRG